MKNDAAKAFRIGPNGYASLRARGWCEFDARNLEAIVYVNDNYDTELRRVVAQYATGAIEADEFYITIDGIREDRSNGRVDLKKWTIFGPSGLSERGRASS